MKYKFRNAATILFISIVLSGCVGLAVSVPLEYTSTKQLKKPMDITNENYLPRKAFSGEKVTRDINAKEIKYESRGDECLYFILLLPYFKDGCESVEIWTFIEEDVATVEKNSYHAFGALCSPIPHVAHLSTSGTGTNRPYYSIFPFCEFRLGNRLNKYEG